LKYGFVFLFFFLLLLLIRALRCGVFEVLSAMLTSLDYVVVVVMTTLMTSSHMTSVQLIFDPVQRQLCDVTVR